MTTKPPPALPPGQRELDIFPRFGLSQFASRFPSHHEISISIGGDTDQTPTIDSSDLVTLERVELTSDFHCVTTWTKRNLVWGGFRFEDFYQQFVHPAGPKEGADCCVFRCQDGYRSSLLLKDLLKPDVLLADQLDGEPLDIAHGSPIRLVAPAHYGFKNPKHLASIEFWTDSRAFKPASPRFMDHPRARVAYEERGQLPGLLLRYLYRPPVKQTIGQFQTALDSYTQS
ncbi:MAG: molybdopterin-dependent oxidoreductase [Pseudomonadales bacterium]|nr:molybdopterin-dependent oxidoreductase [Pseudomonadales bacterium]